MAVDDRFVRMPFEEAIAFLQQKVEVGTDSSMDVTNAQHDAAFVVAGAKGMVLSELRKAVERAIADGTRLEDFRQEFDRIAESWEHRGSKAWRARVIYETNVRMAHAAGRYQRQLDPEVMRVRPYLQYIHGGSSDPRPHHIALDGQVFPAQGLPFYPPNGYLCSCRTISLSNRDLSRLGLEVSQIKRGDRIPTQVNGKEVEAVIEPERGFDFIPGISPQEWRDQYRQQVLTRLESPLMEQVKASMDEADRRAKPPEAERSLAPTTAPSGEPRIPIGTGTLWRKIQSRARRKFGATLDRADAAIQAGSDIVAKASARIRQLSQQMQEAINAGDRAAYDRLRTEAVEVQRESEAALANREDPIKVMADLRQQIIDSAQTISLEAARVLASKFDVPSAVAQEYGSEAAFRAVLAEVIQLSDGRGMATLRRIELTDDRASASAKKQSINVGRKDTMEERRSTFFHEFAHHWEYGDHRGKSRKLMAVSRDFIFNKATSPTVRPLRELTGISQYGADEVALPGVSPISPYVGRSYSEDPNDRSVLVPTEVFSMGFQYFHSPKAMLELYRTDRDLFELTLGALR